MFGDGNLSPSRAAGEEFAHPPGKLFYILAVYLFSTGSFTFPASRPGFAVGQTFLFRLCQRFRFDQQPLPFITFSGPTPFENHRAQGGVFP